MSERINPLPERIQPKRANSRPGQWSRGRQMRLIAFAFILTPYVVWLALMPFTRHYDFALMTWKAHHINLGQWNLYAYFDQLEQNFTPRGHPAAAYPFGMYFLLSVWIEALQFLRLIDYTTWTTPQVILESSATVLLIKMLHLAAHLTIGGILCRVAPPGWRWQAWALWAWSVSPAYLLLMGQNDLPLALAMVGATALCAQALRYRQAQDTRWRLLALAGAVALGLGATYKTSPLMLAIPFALLLSPRWHERLMFVGVPAAIFISASLPFLGTPAFVNGTLFNREGLNLFSKSPVFVQPTSLFVVTYAAFVLTLLIRRWEAARPIDLWLVGAGILSGIFPFVQTAFYWLVWLTPFIIGLIAQDATRRGLWLISWLAIEIAFGALLFWRHQDFSFGLLDLGSSQFRLAHLEVALSVYSPLLSRVFSLIWDIAHSLQTAAWLLVIGATLSALIARSGYLPWLVRPRRVSVLIAIGVPLFACASLAAVALWILRDAKAEGFARRASSEVTLSPSQPTLVQTLSPPIALGHALLLWSRLPATPVEIEACARRDDRVVCARGTPLQITRFTGYVFKFERPQGEGVGAMEKLELRLAHSSPEASVGVPILPLQPVQEQHRVVQEDAVREGIVRMMNLRSFSLVKAISDIGDRIASDWRLAPLWLLALATIGLLAKRAVARQPSPSARPRRGLPPSVA